MKTLHLRSRKTTGGIGLEAMVERIGTYQKPDGHFGAEQKMPPISPGVDMPICWGHGRLLIGLVEAHERAHCPKALEIARKLGDYFLATADTYGKAENKNLGGKYAAAFGTCYLSCIEGLVGLARAAKDDRYLKQAVRMAELAADPDFVPGYHSHGRLSTLRGLLDIHPSIRPIPHNPGRIGEMNKTPRKRTKNRCPRRMRGTLRFFVRNPLRRGTGSKGAWIVWRSRRAH